MLNRQIGYFISKYGRLAKFTAAEFLHCNTGKGSIGHAERACSTAPKPHFTIHLESAVFMFHMTGTTQESPGHCEPRVRSPSNGFWLAPSQLTKTDAPNTRVSLAPLARSWPTSPGACPLILERTHLLTSFQDFGLADPISRALKEENYLTPTPIQAQTIPLALAGRDVVGIAQTGTGKTAAFALPILHRILEHRLKPQPKACRVLVLSPTRELSGQILESFNAYGRHMRLTSALAIGGVPMGRQVRSILQGVEVMVATPGRLLDLVQSNGLKLGQVEFLVLDEADRMLDMGFINDIRKIVAKLPIKRQTLLEVLQACAANRRT